MENNSPPVFTINKGSVFSFEIELEENITGISPIFSIQQYDKTTKTYLDSRNYTVADGNIVITQNNPARFSVTLFVDDTDLLIFSGRYELALISGSQKTVLFNGNYILEN
jgi:hypothetical protein